VLQRIRYAVPGRRLFQGVGVGCYRGLAKAVPEGWSRLFQRVGVGCVPEGWLRWLLQRIGVENNNN